MHVGLCCGWVFGPCMTGFEVGFDSGAVVRNW